MPILVEYKGNQKDSLVPIYDWQANVVRLIFVIKMEYKLLLHLLRDDEVFLYNNIGYNLNKTFHHRSFAIFVSCLGPLLDCSQIFKFFGFQSFYFKRIWWRLFQKHAVSTKFDIYDFIVPHCDSS
jgi:hypothetical protein